MMDKGRLETNIVPPDGPLDAKVLFVGQAPGAEEDFKLRPFVGGAGILFNRCLKTIGKTRHEVLVTNLFSQRPPNNEVNYFFQDKGNTKPTWEGQEHIDVFQSWLQRLINTRDAGLRGPNVIVALGQPTIYFLTGKKRVLKWRGSILPCTLVTSSQPQEPLDSTGRHPSVKVYPMMHPSYVNRLMNEPEERLFGAKKKQQQNALPLFLKDLQRVFEQAEFPEIRTPKREFQIAKSVDDAIGFLRNIREITSVDIETLRGKSGPVVWCIGFGPRPDLAMCIPIIRNKRLCWTAKEEAKIWRAASEVFLDEKILKIFQGGFYDLSILGKYYGLRLAPGTYGDTMWLHHASYPYLRKALEVLTSIYTWEPYYKDDGKVWDGRRISDYSEFIYNSRDCCVQREIYPVVKRDAKVLGTYQAYKKQMSRTGSLLHMQMRGVRINVEKKERLAKEFAEKSSEAKEKFMKTSEGSYNLDSSAQMIKVLYGLFNLPIQYHHKTKRPTIDKDARNRLLKKVREGSKEHILIKALTEYKKFAKLSNTYTSMEVGRDGRIYTSYRWVSTFRLSSSESHFGGGGNLQNIPARAEEGRAIRELFIPDGGHIFVAPDLRQAEAMEVAWLANDTALIELYLNGFDVHWHRAREVFGIPDDYTEEVYKTNPDEQYQSSILGKKQALEWFRRIGKTIVHAGNYKMGPRMLQTILIREEVYLPESTCKQLLHAFRRRSPLITQWQEKTIEEIKATRTLTTPPPFSRKREFRGRRNDALYRSAVAFRPQSVVGEIMQEGTQRVWEATDKYEPLINVHDENVGQCRPEDLPTVLPILKESMEIPHYPGGRELIIPCDFKIGPSWGELKEVDYEDILSSKVF